VPATPLTMRFAADGVKPLVVLAYTVYELIVQFAGGVTVVQLRPMAVEEEVVAASPVGAEGRVEQVPPLPSVMPVAWAEAVAVPSPSEASTM